MIKKIIFGLTIISSLFSCSNNGVEEVGENGANLKFSLGISEIKTRSIGPGADQSGLKEIVRKNIKSIRLEFKTASDVVLASHDLNSEQLAAIKGNKTIVFENIQTSTAKVSAYMNTISGDEGINDLQQNAGFELKHMEYSGTGEVRTSSTVQSNGHVLWNASVQVSPTFSRFEVKGKSVLKIVSTPENKPEATREEAKSHFSEEILAKKEQEARDLCDAADSYTYKYALVFTPHFTGENITVENVYVNNFKNTRSATNLIYHKGDGINSWEDVAERSYGTSGTHSHMWDLYNITEASHAAGYNLFPQRASSDALETVKKEMPHIILKLKMNQNGSFSTRWLTIRSFFKKDAPESRILSFDAGSVYRLNLDAINLTRFTVSLTVSANGGKPTKPEIINPDPTDPMPEPVNIDLSVGLEILDWNYIEVTPEL